MTELDDESKMKMFASKHSHLQGLRLRRRVYSYMQRSSLHFKGIHTHTYKHTQSYLQTHVQHWLLSLHFPNPAHLSLLSLPLFCSFRLSLRNISGAKNRSVQTRHRTIQSLMLKSSTEQHCVKQNSYL